MILRQKESDSHIHLDFVPMVDVLFNLLVFFLLATTLKQAEREMHIALPEARASGPISATLREIVLNVEKNGRIVMAGREIAPDSLRDVIASAVKDNPTQKVTVRGDRDAAYSSVVRVLDICKAGGIQEPFLDTIMTGGE